MQEIKNISQPTQQGQEKMKKKVNVGLIIGSVLISIFLLMGAAFAGYLLLGGGQEEIKMSKYVSVYASGVEGQVGLEIYIDEYALEDDYSYEDYQEALSFLEQIKYTYNNEILPISFDEEIPAFDLKKNQVVEIQLEYDANFSKQSKYKADVKTITYKVENLDVIIKDINEVSKEALSEHLQDVKKYEEADGDALVAMQRGEHINTFYKIEDTYEIMGYDEVTQTSGLTLLHAYLYEGRVYLAGETNIVLSYEALWGYIYYEDALNLTLDERNPENIQTALESRGYTAYQN